MAKKKVYAVRNGKKTGLFYTWDECKAAIEGYSGAVFKGFFTEEEAKAYLNGGAEEIPEPGQIIAYVDGSFEVSLGRYAYGCVILTPDGKVIRESGSGNNPESAALRNVTGEMLGSIYAVQWCIRHGYQAVDIRYDYMGIEMWATGGWKAKNDLTQRYAEYMQRNAQRIKITFKKIAAHTGDKYNEEADKLAKAALAKEE